MLAQCLSPSVTTSSRSALSAQSVGLLLAPPRAHHIALEFLEQLVGVLQRVGGSLLPGL
jgi:hypothetical protein